MGGVARERRFKEGLCPLEEAAGLAEAEGGGQDTRGGLEVRPGGHLRDGSTGRRCSSSGWRGSAFLRIDLLLEAACITGWTGGGEPLPPLPENTSSISHHMGILRVLDLSAFRSLRSIV